MRARRLLPSIAILLGVTIAIVSAGVPGTARVDRGLRATEVARREKELRGFDNTTNKFEEQGPFLDDKKQFDTPEEVFPNDKKEGGGLGPVYNATSCVDCHQNAGFVIEDPNDPTKFTGSGAVSGTSSQVSEIRAGHNERFRDPGTGHGTLLFVEAPGGSLIEQRATDPLVQETVPDGEKLRTLRMATSVLGDGFVECIEDTAIKDVQAAQDADIKGTIVCVPVAVEAVGNGEFKFASRPGRFGWKCQEASLLNFAAGAYLAEMGITNPLNPQENTSLGRGVRHFDPVADPEDDTKDPKDPTKVHAFGNDVEAFTRFMRSTKPPPQENFDPNSADGQRILDGRQLFIQIGCAKCHVREWKTAPKCTPIASDLKTVPEALGGKTIQPYSDFMLHDIGTGDGIVQTQFSDMPPSGLNPFAAEASERARVDTIQRLNALLRGVSETEPEAVRERERRLPGGGPCPDAIQVRPPAPGGQSMVFTRQTAKMIRTAPLWGLRTRPQLLHDGRALTIRQAIKAHRGQANRIRRAFDRLRKSDQEHILAFLGSL